MKKMRKEDKRRVRFAEQVSVQSGSASSSAWPERASRSAIARYPGLYDVRPRLGQAVALSEARRAVVEYPSRVRFTRIDHKE